MRALLAYVRPHRGALVVAAVLGLLGAVAGLAQPLAEASSQLDAVNEQALRSAVASAAADRAVAQGTHAELVEGDELYRELAATQLTA